MNKNINFIMVTSLVPCLTAAVIAQVATGGSFSLAQAVVGNGGGQSAGGSFGSTGTAGQSVAGGASTGAPFTVRSGFWQAALAPTAAGVVVAGRVLTADGAGLRNAAVIITDSRGVEHRVLTGAFGHYRFDEVQAGDTYVVMVKSRRFQFAPRVVGVTDSLTDVDFVPLP